jgi:hypothetical protein
MGPAGPPAPQREGRNQFDGAWTFVVASTNCVGSAVVREIISSGKLTAKGTNGQISPSGAYLGAAMGADGVQQTLYGECRERHLSPHGRLRGALDRQQEQSQPLNRTDLSGAVKEAERPGLTLLHVLLPF